MIQPLPPEALRWRCDAESLNFATTDELSAAPGVVGQASAMEALRFGLECDAPGQNVFVRGLTGTGRMTLVGQMLEELKPVRRTRVAYCYVHNFSEQDRPRLIAIPVGMVKTFKRRIRELAEFIRDGLRAALDAAPNKAEREAIERRRQALEVLTGVAAGERGEDGDYPEGMLLATAVKKAREFWLKSLQKPVGRAAVDGDAEAAGNGA